MTAVLDRATKDDQPVGGQDADDLPASWLSRAGALAVDVLPGLGVVATFALVGWTAARDSWLWWLSVGVAAAVTVLIAANRLVLPWLTGWSLGRALLGIAVVRPGRSGAVVGPLRLLARDLAHLLDTAAVFVGWLWPLWDSRNRTFADLLVRTEVRRAPRPRPDMPRLAIVALLVAALLATAGAGLSYLTVFRYEHGTQTAGDQIRDQGPRIVEELLSYGAASAPQDFAYAQTLVTDGYREQLIKDQESLAQAPPTTNELWVVAKSVLSATPDRATMLLFLQGQRQIQQQASRPITATVRVDFEKSAEDWRVAGLSVLKKPYVGGGGQ